MLIGWMGGRVRGWVGRDWFGAKGRRSYEDLGERVGPGAGDEGLGGVERHVVDGLLELLAVRRELLDARLVVQVPQPDGAVVA